MIGELMADTPLCAVGISPPNVMRPFPFCHELFLSFLAPDFSFSAAQGWGTVPCDLVV